MKSSNAFSPLATAAIDRIRDLAAQLGDVDLPVAVRDRGIDEIEFHKATLGDAFAFRKVHGPSLGGADSDVYFREKLESMVSFAIMSLDRTQRDGYPTSKIIENVDHYSYLVARLVVAEWTGRSRRPATEKAVKNASFENHDALKRLANR